MAKTTGTLGSVMSPGLCLFLLGVSMGPAVGGLWGGLGGALAGAVLGTLFPVAVIRRAEARAEASRLGASRLVIPQETPAPTLAPPARLVTPVAARVRVAAWRWAA